jgi:sarcosine/dimethylglycine N-methyltransferase
MAASYSKIVETARDYYNSSDADNFYYQIWGGEDIHIGLYASPSEPIAKASQRTIETMIATFGPITAETRVVDLGAGYGGTARLMARRYGCHVDCVNLSEVQNERNREFNREAGLEEQIDVYDDSFENVPLADASYDLVWSQDSILHAGDRDRVLGEVDRLLKPGGSFVFTDPMQADDCDIGALQPILDRLHLTSLGSFAYYRAAARRLGWAEVEVTDFTNELVNHYTRVRDELESRYAELKGTISPDYFQRMIAGLGHWIEGGTKGNLAWGILHFKKPE